MYTSVFWKDTFERVVKTVFQTLIALFIADGVVSIVEIDFGHSLGVAGFAALMSLLTSVASAPVGEPGLASAVHLSTTKY